MAYFPLFIEMNGKKCLLIGGGNVAFRKAKALLSYGAELIVVAEKCGEELKEMERKKEVVFFCRKAVLEDAKGMDMVFCASDDKEFHQKMAAYCREKMIPVNVADDREESSFLFPALIRQEDVVLGITTGGNSPAASRYLKEEISKILPQYLGKLVNRLGSFRPLIKNSLFCQKEREEVFSRLFSLGLERNGEIKEEDVLLMIRNVKEREGSTGSFSEYAGRDNLLKDSRRPDFR